MARGLEHIPPTERDRQWRADNPGLRTHIQHAEVGPNVPWHRQAWPWLLMSMPAIALVAGSFTFWLAVTSNHSLVVDDYYSAGKAINRDIARDRAALDHHLTARSSSDAAGVTIELEADASFDMPQRLRLRLIHATRSELDREVLLERVTATAGESSSAADTASSAETAPETIPPTTHSTNHPTTHSTSYRATTLPLPASGHWHAQIDAAQADWRLTTSSTAGFAGPVRFGGQP